MKPNRIPIADWKEQRRQGIGGSDAPVIMGVNPYKGRYELFLEKLGEFERDVEVNEAMHFGKVLESVIAQEFERRSGIRVRRCNYILQRPDLPWMIGNIDREGTDRNGKRFVLECKNVGQWSDKSFKNDGVPPMHTIQVLHYVIVGGYDYGIVSALIGGNRYEERRIEPDAVLMDQIIEAEREFWHDIESGSDPNKYIDPVDNDFMDERFTADGDMGAVDLSDVSKAIQDIADIRGVISGMETRVEQLQAVIKDKLRNSEKGFWRDYIVNWREVISNRLDTKALQLAHPEVCEKFIKSSTSRRFEIKQSKGEKR